MHDAKGRPLEVGDVVLVPMIVEQCYATEDYCNVTMRSVHGRKPDGMKECLTGNTAVVFRAGGDDINTHEEMFPITG